MGYVYFALALHGMNTQSRTLPFKSGRQTNLNPLACASELPLSQMMLAASR